MQQTASKLTRQVVYSGILIAYAGIVNCIAIYCTKLCHSLFCKIWSPISYILVILVEFPLVGGPRLRMPLASPLAWPLGRVSFGWGLRDQGWRCWCQGVWGLRTGFFWGGLGVRVLGCRAGIKLGGEGFGAWGGPADEPRRPQTQHPCISKPPNPRSPKPWLNP